MNLQASDLTPSGPSVSFNPLAYEPRACHSFGSMTVRDKTYKLYVILSHLHGLGDCPNLATLQSLVAQAFEGWDAPEDHPTGFGMLHLARDGTYVLASRWSNANNLRHRTFGVDLSRPDPVPERLVDPHVVACVWELGLMKREADAWISTVLSHGAPALTAEMIRDYADLQYTGPL